MLSDTVRPVIAHRNAAERIERELTRAILRGRYAPGGHLPPVRDLAKEFDVNPATVQRALARLEVKGLVTARHGSGLTVNDPVERGEISLVPDWLDARSDDPDAAAALLEELLEVRRVLAIRLIVDHRDQILAAVDDLVAEAPRMLDAAGGDVMAVDLAIARRVIGAAGKTVVLALIASVERALADLPLLVAAMYGVPERNVASTLDVVEAIRAGGDHLADRLGELMSEMDRATVVAYRLLLVEAVETASLAEPASGAELSDPSVPSVPSVADAARSVPNEQRALVPVDRDAIIDSVGVFVVSRSVEAVTLDELAAIAGVRVEALTAAFPGGRDEIVDAVLGSRIDSIVERGERVINDAPDAVAALEGVMTLLVMQANGSPAMAALLAGSVAGPPLSPMASRLRSEVRRLWVRIDGAPRRDGVETSAAGAEAVADHLLHVAVALTRDPDHPRTLAQIVEHLRVFVVPALFTPTHGVLE